MSIIEQDLIKEITKKTRYQILTKIYNLPWILCDVVKDRVIQICIDGNKYIFRINFYVNNEFNFRHVLENNDGKIILDFKISPLLGGDHEVYVRAAVTTSKFLQILNYIKVKLKTLFEENSYVGNKELIT